MTYFIKHANGDLFYTIQDGTLDTQNTSLVTVGKNYPEFGEIFNQNYVSLLENFAHNVAPANPTQGQLWYDTNDQAVKLYRQTPTTQYWQPVSFLVQGDAPPANANNGDLWWDSKNQQLNLFYNNDFTTIGPQITNPGQLRTDNTDFTIQVQGTNVFHITSTGQLTLPYNAAFYCSYRKNPFNTTYYLGSGTEEFTSFDPVYVTVNNGNCWQDIGGSNAFVCPVDGTYEVQGYMNTLGGATGYNTHRIMFWINQNYTNVEAQNNHPTGQSQTLSVHGFLKCNAGDYIIFVLSASLNARINDAYSGFSVRLVG